MLDARELAEQRRLFEAELAPVFDSPLVRQLADLPAAYFGLGIPPAQFDALKADAGGNLATLLRARVERLACDFPIQENWFAWQAFGRPLSRPGRTACRPTCGRRISRRSARAWTGSRSSRSRSPTILRRQDARTVDAYVLLDAQDWMSRAQIAALWARSTAPPGPAPG